MLAPAVGSYCLAVILAGTATTGTGFIIAGALAGLGHGYCFPVLTSLVVNRIPAAHRGSGLAAFTALWDVASLFLPPIFGGIADGHGDSVMFIAASLCATAGIVFWLVSEVKMSRRSS